MSCDGTGSAKFIAFLILTLAFVAIFASVYLIHIWWLPVNVIFYSALLDAAIACALTGLLSVVMRRHLPVNGFELALMFMIWGISGYAIAISGPTVLDRSLSFYILEKLQQRGGGIRKDAMARIFIDEYMPEFRLIDVRLTEQLDSGTIEIVNGCVRLTAKGARLASISSFVRTNLLARHRLLAGIYTDALINPLSKGRQGAEGYECR